MAIRAVVLRPMDCFVPRNDGAGRIDGVGGNDNPFRHCEARSAVAIQAVVLRPMDCFVPRNDGAGAQ